VSVALWLYADALTANDVIVSSGFNYAANQGWLLKYDSATGNKLHVLLGTTASAAGYTLTTGSWQHIAATINASGYTVIYVNGSQVASGTATNAGIDTSRNTQIASEPANSNNIDGKIDEVMLWNRSLTAAEVNQSYMSNLYKYASDSWQFYTNQSGLGVATYTYFGSAKDAAGNANQTETRQFTVTSNTAPSAPTAQSPNGTLVVVRPILNWSIPADANEDNVSFRLEVYTDLALTSPIHGSPFQSNLSTNGFLPAFLNVTQNSGVANYTFNYTLVPRDYYWRVYAFDGQLLSSPSALMNFTVLSVVDISLVNSTMEFGLQAISSNINDSFGTYSSSNILTNITIYGSDLFYSQPNPSSYYTFMSWNNESNSAGYLVSSWTQIPATSGTAVKCLGNLNYNDSVNSAWININATVPADEPSGRRSSTLTLTGAAAL
jgi:hypothetical protein